MAGFPGVVEAIVWDLPAKRSLSPDRCHELSGPHDVHDPREIVGEDVYCHLATDPFQRLYQEVGCAPPCLDCAEGCSTVRVADAC
jgi:hypothetical protein